jgi:sugar phosphate isomerase/epimerase
MKRRAFLQKSAIALGGAAITRPAWATVQNNVGIQLFTIPQMVAKDFPGTLKQLSDIGYREIEFFGPYAFSSPKTIDGWKPLAAQMGITQNAFYGYTLSDVRKLLSDLNLTTPSVHLDLITLRENLSASAEALAALGTRYVALPALMNPAERQTLDHYKRLATEFNQIGEKLSKYGLVFTYHNHGYEHAPKDGAVPMDVLLQQTDARYVAFEMDIFWLAAGGGSPIEFLTKYPGRFPLMHVKDAAQPIRFTGDGGTPDQWMALFPKMADPGSGVFDLKSIITTARAQGTKHFYLERDLAPDPATTLKNSYAYLSAV